MSIKHTTLSCPIEAKTMESLTCHTKAFILRHECTIAVSDTLFNSNQWRPQNLVIGGKVLTKSDRVRL